MARDQLSSACAFARSICRRSLASPVTWNPEDQPAAETYSPRCDASIPRRSKVRTQQPCRVMAGAQAPPIQTGELSGAEEMQRPAALPSAPNDDRGVRAVDGGPPRARREC